MTDPVDVTARYDALRGSVVRPVRPIETDESFTVPVSDSEQERWIATIKDNDACRDAFISLLRDRAHDLDQLEYNARNDATQTCVIRGRRWENIDLIFLITGTRDKPSMAPAT